MAEGLYRPNQFEFPQGLPTDKILLSVVKVRPKRRMSYQRFDTLEEAENWSEWITHSDGSQTFNYGVIDKDREECRNPEFSSALFSHELCEIYKSGGSLPKSVDLKGNGNGFLISSDGLVLTNHHLVSGAIEAAQRNLETVINKPIEIDGVEIEYPVRRDENGEIIYKKAERVYLVSSPSVEYAYKNKHDLALLKIDVGTENFVSLSAQNPKVGDDTIVIGFTMRSARSEESKRKYKYDDANYDLRVSRGNVLEIDSASTFLSDCDGGPGNSGSLTLNHLGEVIGVYFGSTGNGLVNPTNIKRRHVSIEAVRKLFQL